MYNDDKDIIDLDSTMNWSKLDIKREIDNREINEETGNRYDYARGFVEDEQKEQQILLDGLTSGLNYIPEEFLLAADDMHDKEMKKLPQEEKPDVSWAYRDAPPSTGVHGASSSARATSSQSAQADGIQTRTTAQINAAKLREQMLARERAEEQAKAQAKLAAQANAREKAEAEAAVQASIEQRKRAREEAAKKQEAIARANAEALRKEREEKATKRKAEQQRAQEKMYKPSKEGKVDMFSTQMLDIEYIDSLASESEQKIRATKEERVAASKKNRNAADEYASWANGSDDEYVPKKKKPKKSSNGGHDDHHKKGSGGGSKSSKPKKKKKEDMTFWERILYFFESKSTLDYLVMGTGVLVVAAACITLGIYSASKNTKAAIANFVPLGQEMQGIGSSGSGKLVAVADATKLLAEMEVEEEQPAEEEDLIKDYEEKEDENEGVISVTMSLTSVKRDLKIKFINAKTKKLVGNHQFKVDIEDSKGKKYSASDDDKDGIIYLNSVEPGKTKVSMVAMPDDKNVTFSTETATITVKEKIEYKKLDVADEIKSEKQVNAAKEDTAVANVVEGELKDTVEWVESTKTKIGDVKMTPIDATKLDNVPKASAKASYSIGNLYKAASDFLCMRAYAACETHDWGDWTTTKEPTCTEKGTQERKCKNCDEKETEDIDMKSHEYENGKCKVCGAEDPNAAPTPTPTPEPTPTPGPTPTTAPTPTPAVTPSPAPCANNAHTFDSGKVTKEATCKEKGEKVLTCTKCGFTKKEEIPVSTKHTFENGKCKVCGKADDSTTKLLYKKQPVYLDEAGTKEATMADYYAGTKTFYVGETTGTSSSGKEQYKYTGWQEINGNMYFYTKDGVPVTGEQVIQGAKYNFDSTGALVKGSGTMGIDVSKWNGNINWDAVKNSGVSFVIIRCGYRGSSSGAMIEDPKFKSNIQGAQKAGLKVGIYFFSQAISDVEAVEEASMTVQLIKNYKISYPVFLDVEGSGGRGDKIDKGTRTAVIQAYCQTLKNSGYTPGVYANKTWLNEKINTGSLSGYKIWLAQYNTAPTYSGHYDMWQYSSKGKVGGIGGNTDMNISYLGY